MASNPKFHVFEDVAMHDQTEDCWIIIAGKVYNVSSFMDDHPGGPEVLLAATARDATTDFEETGHSDYAKGLMDKYCIGEIDMSTVPLLRAHTQTQTTHKGNTTKESSSFVVKLLQLIGPLLILWLAFSAYTKDK